MVVPDGGDRNAPGNPFYNTKKESERSGGAGRRHEATRSRGVILEFYGHLVFKVWEVTSQLLRKDHSCLTLGIVQDGFDVCVRRAGRAVSPR